MIVSNYTNPTAIPQVVSLANEVISNPDHQLAQDQFAQSLKELLDSIHATQTALTAEPGEQPPFPTVVSIIGLQAHYTICITVIDRSMT